MCSASGSRASRVYMGGLPERGALGARRGDGLADTIGGGASGDIVDLEDGLEGESCFEVGAEGWVDGLEFCEREVFQLAVFLETNLDGFADLLVRQAEGHALANEVGGGGPGIEEAGFGGLFHARKLELDATREGGGHGQDG